MDDGRAKLAVEAMDLMTALVPLTQLAAELGVDRGNARKIARRLGMVPVRQQVLALGHHQRTLCWTREQADQILAERRAAGFEVPGRASAKMKATAHMTARASDT